MLKLYSLFWFWLRTFNFAEHSNIFYRKSVLIRNISGYNIININYSNFDLVYLMFSELLNFLALKDFIIKIK